MDGVKLLVGAEAAGSDRSEVRFVVVGIGVGTVRSRVGLGGSKVGLGRSGFGVEGFGRVRVSIMHCIYFTFTGGKV